MGIGHPGLDAVRMVMHIKPIPTRYEGVTFRSRLEASYAATLDHMGVPWQYEPEGYQLSDGSWYLPDFYLPTCHGWLEVKGDHQERMSKVEQFAADLWKEAGEPDPASPSAPMVVLAKSPRRGVVLKGGPGTKGLIDGENPSFLAVRGPLSRYSTAWMHCYDCRNLTFMARNYPRCRNCQSLNLDLEGYVDYYLARFVRVAA